MASSKKGSTNHIQLHRQHKGRRYRCGSAGSESQDIELMLGSRVSILPMSVVTELFTDVSLTKSKRRLKDYGGNPIAVKGCLRANVAFGGHTTNRDIYIVYQGSAVLGRDLFRALRMQVVDGQVTPVPLCSQKRNSGETRMCKGIHPQG